MAVPSCSVCLCLLQNSSCQTAAKGGTLAGVWPVAACGCKAGVLFLSGGRKQECVKTGASTSGLANTGALDSGCLSEQGFLWSRQKGGRGLLVAVKGCKAHQSGRVSGPRGVSNGERGEDISLPCSMTGKADLLFSAGHLLFSLQSKSKCRKSVPSLCVVLLTNSDMNCFQMVPSLLLSRWLSARGAEAGLNLSAGICHNRSW